MTSRNLISVGRFRTSALAGLAAAALALSSCNPGGEPGSRGTATPSTESEAPSQTASPTPTPSAAYKPADATGRAQNVPVPVLPEVAKTETKEGALAFASYWFSALSYAYETGDLSRVASLAPDSCSACRKSAEAIQAWHSEGRWLVGGRISTPAIETTFTKDPESKYKVAVQVHQEPLTYLRADGTVARADAQAADTGNLLVISFADSAWMLHEIGSIVG